MAAAGNDSLNTDATPVYPASLNLDNIISVAATDHNDNLASFSNYGRNSVDLGAPGVNILSTLPNGSYGMLSGTSMAAPHVAGVVALVHDLHLIWTYREVIDRVLSTSDSVSSLQGKTATGGRLNAGSAVQPVSPSPLVVTNIQDSGLGSLRDAIIFANSLGGPQTVVFNIPTTDPGFAGGVFTIRPQSDLPVLVNGVTIDGTSQTAFTGDTNPLGPEVVLNGSMQPSGDGLRLDDNNIVRGLVINGFAGYGVVLSWAFATGGVANNNRILDNYIGTDPTGTSAVPNGASGILIVGFASPGVQSSNNLIQDNLISGNQGQGIALGDAADNQILNNRIGTDRTGMAALGNQGMGVALSNAGAPRNRIQDNIIAFNTGDGIHDSPDYRYPVAFTPDGHQGNAFLGNSIFSNGGLGINLLPAPLGSEPGSVVTPNDPGDTDVGANNLQNFPVLGSAVTFGGGVTIQGTLNSTPNRAYRIDFFANTSSDPSGFGEGERFLGFASVTTDGSGNANFSVSLAVTVPAGQFITATATDPNGNTSEFSQARIVTVSLFTVTNTSDSGPGSLRQTILYANSNPGLDTITFNIPGTGTRTIAPLTELPIITDPVVIDGYTQPGASPNTLTVGDNAVLRIELNGQFVTASGSPDGGPTGLRLHANDSVIQGLMINRFSTRGIRISRVDENAGARNTIAGNFIGTDVTGQLARGNGQGISIDGGLDNTVGGTTPAARNIISGNNEWGVFLYGNGVGPRGNRLQGNYIGTDVTGGVALGNGRDGIKLLAIQAETIGGLLPGAGNVISGNAGDGIAIDGGETDANLIQGNFIGTDATGTRSLGNSGNGVGFHVNPQGNTIGGTSAAARNVISGNTGHGVAFDRALRPVGNTVQGNYIGTDVSGTMDLGNGADGIHIGSSRNVMVGGTDPGASNLISGNGGSGIHILRSSQFAAETNTVQGNFIGVNVIGSHALGNGEDGVRVVNAGNNTIGGTTTAARNVISGNSVHGIRIEGELALGNTVQGNYIGTDASGSMAVRNAGNGVLVLGARNNVVGGLSEGARNVISGNFGSGVQIVGPVYAPANWVQGNYIGTDVTGTQPLGNLFGVYVHGNYTVVGGPEPGAGNLIAYNLNNGIFNDGTSNYAIRRNSIFGHGDIGIGGHNTPPAPALTSVMSDGNTLLIQGDLTGAPNTTIEIEFFSNLTPHWTGFGEGQTYIDTTSVTTNSTGQVSFSVVITPTPAVGLWISATATHVDTSTSRFSNSVQVAAYVPQGVDSVDIDDGSGQRSSVRSVTVTFSGIVTLAPDAIQLYRQDWSLVDLSVSSFVSAGRTVAVLTFSGDDVIAGSLADGDYWLVVWGDLIHDGFGRSLDADGDGTEGGYRVDAFFRYFGDSDGDRDVDDLDYVLFDRAFGTQAGDPDYLGYFDFGGDGDVDDTDFFQFLERYGKVLAP